jgi:hypothetical protein
MKKEKETILDYSFFKSPSNPIISPFTKLLIVIFAFYSILSFSDDGLINSLSENIISEYKISPSQYSSIKMFICLGKIACSISLIKLIKKISNYYKLYCIISLIIKALILISYYYEYSFFVFLVTRGISSFINLYEFVFFVSWFSEQIKKPLFGLLITFLTIYIGSLFGYFFNYLNYDQAVSEKWRANFLLLGIIYFIFSFLLMLVSSNSFKLKKNVYYPSSRWGNLKNKNIEEENNINNNNSNNSLFNMDALMEIKKKMEILENKYILYDLSLEEKLKTMSVSEFNYFQELKNMIINKKYIFTIISLSIFSLIYSTILFWFNDYIINNLHLKQSNTMLINYAIISFFGPLLGIIINRAVELTTNFKKEAKLFSILINSVILCIISIFIQIKVLLEYSNILFLFYISILFYLFPDMIVLHLKYTQYTFRKEDFVLLVFTKNFLGETVGSYIYSIGGMSMILNFSWGLLGLLCCILYLEFITVEKKINNKKVNENKKIEKYRTTVTSDIQGEELKEIDNRESIISVDDTDDNNDKNDNKEHEYNLDDYIKK